MHRKRHLETWALWSMAVLLATGIVWRATFYGHNIWFEALVASSAVLVGGVASFICSKYSLPELFESHPIWSVMILYVVGTCLLWVGTVVVRSNRIAPAWGAYCFALAMVPVIHSQPGKGYVGLLVCLLAPAPGYWLLNEAHCTSGIVLLVIVQTGLLFSVCTQKLFGDTSQGLLGVIIFLIAAGLWACVFVFGPGELKKAIEVRVFPWSEFGPGYWDALNREIMDTIPLIGQTERTPLMFDSPPYMAMEKEYLLSKAALGMGGIAVIITLTFGILISVSTFVISIRKSGVDHYVSLAATLLIGGSVVLYILQNVGYHMVYIRTMPFLTTGFFETAFFVFLLFMILDGTNRRDFIID